MRRTGTRRRGVGEPPAGSWIEQLAEPDRGQLLFVEPGRTVDEPEHRGIVQIAIELETRAASRAVVPNLEQRHAHSIEIDSLALVQRDVTEEVVGSRGEESAGAADQFERACGRTPEQTAPRSQSERPNANV